MNLSKLFELQRELDERIVREKGLEGQDLLPQKILALQVELGELANEWRGFKVWSNDREPRRAGRRACSSCYGRKCDADGVVCKACKGWGFEDYNPLLEEYVDCLHFILSIGLDLWRDPERSVDFGLHTGAVTDITRQFIELFQCVGEVENLLDPYDWTYLLREFIRLGNALGFTWEEVEQAYIAKNAVNHERQANGY